MPPANKPTNQLTRRTDLYPPAPAYDGETRSINANENGVRAAIPAPTRASEGRMYPTTRLKCLYCVRISINLEARGGMDRVHTGHCLSTRPS